MHLQKNESPILISFQSFHNQMPKSWLQQQASLHPNQIALYSIEGDLTFSELNHDVQKYAYYFDRFFANKQQQSKRIAILSNNDTKMYFTILALWELGMEIQFLNTRLTKDELIYQLADAKTPFMITELYESTVFGNVSILPFPTKVIKELHPSPALGGEPKQLSMTWLADKEPTGRGLYGGPIGWCDLMTDNGEFAVGIRSGVISQTNVLLYAGCGIVPESTPEAEYLETALKFQPMLRGVKE